MSIFIGGKEVVAVRAFGKDITAIYKGSKLVWQQGNFITRDNNIFCGRDGAVFNVKEK